MIDLGTGGAKLRSASCIPIGEVLQLKLVTHQLDFEFQGTAEVCWSRALEGEEWLVGCAFRPQIPDHTIDKLANCGLLERRDSVRRQVSLPVTIHWELDEEPDSAKLQDYSDGGFCIAINRAAEPGQRLSMSCEAPYGEQLEIQARVQWMLETPDHNLVGCSILLGQDFGRLSALTC